MNLESDWLLQARRRSLGVGSDECLGILASDWSEHWRWHTMFISRQPIRGQAEFVRQKKQLVCIQIEDDSLCHDKTLLLPFRKIEAPGDYFWLVLVCTELFFH